MITVNISKDPLQEVTLPIKQRDITVQKMETRTFEELHNTSFAELQNEYYQDQVIQVDLKLIDPGQEATL